MVARRNILKGLAVLPMAAAMLPSRWAQADMLHEYTIVTPGGRRVGGALAMPVGVPAPTVLLAHDQKGLDAHTRAATAELGRQGFLAVAADMAGMDSAEASLDVLAGWVEWLGVHDASNRHIGVLGWGLGAERALALAAVVPVAAVAVYYGRVSPDAAGRIKSPVLGHFARRDPAVDHEAVTTFATGMAKAGNSCTIHWYDAGRGFADPAARAYDVASAELAWNRTTAFFQDNL